MTLDTQILLVQVGVVAVLVFGFVALPWLAGRVDRVLRGRPARAGAPVPDAARQAALLLRGTLEADSRIHFMAGDREAFVDLSWGRTCVSIDARGRSPGALTIVPSEGSRAGGVVGDREFDREYFVRSRPEALAADVFRPSQRDDVIRLVRRLGKWEAESVELSREVFRVRVSPRLDDPHQVVELAGLARRLFDLMTARESEAPSPALWTDGGQCQVCGTEMKADVVKCAKCATPHHRECWQYVGECSTFACKERRFV